MNSDGHSKKKGNHAVPVITLLTDFGLEDGYVASMKGVILSICPGACLVDISHLIPPQGIRSGAFVLTSAYRCFPKGTVHLAVVDPGVGTARKALVLKTEDYSFVGPDNGLFSWIVQDDLHWECHSLENPEFWRPDVSRTFHGRDIFAPVAAHLARGVPLHTLGPPLQPQLADWASVRRDSSGIHGEVIHVDRFGNAITNLRERDLQEIRLDCVCGIRVGSTSISGFAGTYGESELGSPVALIGGSGHLEIAVNQGDAAALLGLSPGDPVAVCASHSLKS